MTENEIRAIKRYSKKYCLKELSPIGRVLLYIGAVRSYFDGDWRSYYRLWHPIGLLAAIIEVLIRILLEGALSLRWDDYFDTRPSKVKLSFWSAPRVRT